MTLVLRYIYPCVMIPLVLTLIPLCADNIGFDPEANIPFCFFLFSNNSTYFWVVFFFPLLILILCCASLMIFSGYQIHQVLSSSTIPSSSPLPPPTNPNASNLVQENNTTSIHSYNQINTSLDTPNNLLHNPSNSMSSTSQSSQKSLNLKFLQQPPPLQPSTLGGEYGDYSNLSSTSHHIPNHQPQPSNSITSSFSRHHFPTQPNLFPSSSPSYNPSNNKVQSTSTNHQAPAFEDLDHLRFFFLVY